jgi:protein ImuB
MRFTPLVAVVGADALVLDVTGVAHLFGGEAALLARVADGLGRLAGPVVAVLASAPGVALALARAGRAGLVLPEGAEEAAVGPLDIGVLPVGAEVLAALRQLGLRRVEEVARQPRAALLRRFGGGPGRALDEALGHRVPPLSPLRPPVELEVFLEFLEPLSTRAGIDRTVARLLRGLCARLAEAGRGARRVVLRAHRVDGGMQEVAVGVGLASRDPAHLERLFRERLGQLAPGFGFERMALAVEVAEPLGGVQAGFAGSAAGAEARREELARLFDRLGQRVQVSRLAPRPGHWPEREVARVSAHEAVVAPPGWPRAPRPVRLLRRPVPLGAVALLPDAPPSLLRIGRDSHRVRAAEGPERLSPEWWRDPPGREARDYYRVELASGARLWVCRVGFGAAARWYLHGYL